MTNPLTAAFTNPSGIQMSSFDTIPLSIDFTADLSSGQSIQSASITLLDKSNNSASYPSGLSGSPTIVGNVVTQIVTALVAGHHYYLVETITITASTLILSAALEITVPY